MKIGAEDLILCHWEFGVKLFLNKPLLPSEFKVIE